MSAPLLPALDALVERRIREAQSRGEFGDLPGAGRPLPLDDEPLVPEEVRVAHRVLKNAGCLPPEAQHLVEINRLIATLGRAALAEDVDAAHGEAVARRVRALLIRMELAGRPAAAARVWRDYEEALARRMQR